MDEMQHSDHAMEDNPEVRHETSDINVRAVIWSIAIFIGVAVVIHVALYFLFEFFAAGERRRNDEPVTLVRTGRRAQPPEPRLQPFPDQPAAWQGAQQRATFNTPVTDMEELTAREENILTSYGWANREEGLVRIPIDRAMELMLERGVPLAQTPAEATP
jgi:hypothetical protein